MNLLTLTAANTDEIVQKAVATMRGGGIIAYPTETLYGLGAKYDDELALKRLYELKKRAGEKTIPIIIGNLDQLFLLIDEVNHTARELIDKFWPGPLTLIFRARSGLNNYITSDNKIAVRLPGESFALALARGACFPITATSANISGMPPARNAAMITGYFGDRLDLIVDGGESRSAEPSTIVDVTEDDAIVLREGAITIARLSAR